MYICVCTSIFIIYINSSMRIMCSSARSQTATAAELLRDGISHIQQALHELLHAFESAKLDEKSISRMVLMMSYHVVAGIFRFATVLSFWLVLKMRLIYGQK